MRDQVDWVEDGRKAVPLRGKAVEAFGYCKGVFEGCGSGPEVQVAEGGAAFEELGVDEC